MHECVERRYSAVRRALNSRIITTLQYAILRGDGRKYLGLQKLRESITHYVWNKWPVIANSNGRIRVWNVFPGPLSYPATVYRQQQR
jgi:hypothetical protein